MIVTIVETFIYIIESALAWFACTLIAAIVKEEIRICLERRKKNGKCI